MFDYPTNELMFSESLFQVQAYQIFLFSRKINNIKRRCRLCFEFLINFASRDLKN